jgi:hypothetical protein
MRLETSSTIRRLRALYVRSGVQRVLPHSAKQRLRHAWLVVARAIGYPISSPLTLRPPLRRGREPFRLGRALTACDLNAEYLGYWPSMRRAWLEIVGIEPLLVLIANEDDIPAELRRDELVVTFAPLEGVHTALQAQCIRLLYPAVVDTTEAVLITDIDLYPLRRSYYLDPIRGLDGRFFVSYRDTRIDKLEIVMPYNAARPATWGELFDVSSVDDVRARLAEWTRGLEYDGRRAWPGWYTDQKILYRTLMEWPERRNRWWLLDDDYTRHRQLDRLELQHEPGLSERREKGIRRGEYSDYVCLFPYGEHRDVSDRVLSLGLEAAQR